jgi:RNA recognition motif-containing protein
VFIIKRKEKKIMSRNLYVGNLSFTVNEDELRELFEGVGAVSTVKVIHDPHSGRSKGFGFVEMMEDQAADQAVEKLNGHSFKGREIVVDRARPKKDRDSRGGGRRRT